VAQAERRSAPIMMLSTVAAPSGSAATAARVITKRAERPSPVSPRAIVPMQRRTSLTIARTRNLSWAAMPQDPSAEHLGGRCSRARCLQCGCGPDGPIGTNSAERLQVCQYHLMETDASPSEGRSFSGSVVMTEPKPNPNLIPAPSSGHPVPQRTAWGRRCLLSVRPFLIHSSSGPS